MDTNSKNNQQGAVSVGVIAAVVIGVVALGLVGYQHWQVTGLQKQVTETKSQLDQVNQATQQMTQELAEVVAEGAGDIKEAIAGIDNPALRLELFKAYANAIRDKLAPETQKELDGVVVFVEKNVNVLMTPNPELPENIRASVAKIKAELAKEVTDEIASAQVNSADAAKLEVGDEVEVTGALQFSAEDPVTGGGLFTMKTDAGLTLYFTFSPANSAAYQKDFNGKEVTMTLEITSIEDGVVLYDVTEGPELAEADEEEAEEKEVKPTPKPTVKPTAKPTATEE